jgi:hypothetical protein
MRAIGNIYLTWRAGKGHRRHRVGIIRKNSTEGIRFRYLVSPEEASKTGFIPYTDFPDLTKEYTENVLEIFGQRLTKSKRGDIQKYYDFWEIKPEYKDDKYYLLAHTQGLLATDNFEFLADYSPIKGLSFTSEICGLSHNKIDSSVLSVGDDLQWECEPNNSYDPKAIKVFKDKHLIGYVKIVHSGVFHKPGGSGLKIKVKSIEGNGHLSRVFIKIYM